MLCTELEMPTYLSSATETDSRSSWVRELTKSYYKDDQRVKFMHLQAEVDSLLQQLQDLKEQRLASTSQEE